MDLGPSTGAFLGLGPPYSDFEPSRFVVVALPYEKSEGGRAGAAEGPARVLAESRRLEFFDEENFRSAARLGIATIEPELGDLPPEDMAQELQSLAGKIQRHKVRAPYWEGHERRL